MSQHRPDSAGTPSSVELAKETEVLKIKVKEYEEKIAQHSREKSRLGDASDPYTDGEKALLKAVLGKWRKHNTVRMAESILAHAALVKEARHAFDTLNLEKAHLVGHSLGGAVALALAQAHPELVAALHTHAAEVSDMAKRGMMAVHERMMGQPH